MAVFQADDQFIIGARGHAKAGIIINISIINIRSSTTGVVYGMYFRVALFFLRDSLLHAQLRFHGCPIRGAIRFGKFFSHFPDFVLCDFPHRIFHTWWCLLSFLGSGDGSGDEPPHRVPSNISSSFIIAALARRATAFFVPLTGSGALMRGTTAATEERWEEPPVVPTPVVPVLV